MNTAVNGDTVGALMREWRKRRRMSQLDLALEANVSARHLSFVESGRAGASRELLRRVCEHLRVPLRERNRLLLAAGYAPMHPARALDAPEMQAAMTAVGAVLDAAAPYPALVVDRLWNLVRANEAAQSLLAGLPERLTATPANVLRATLDPQGLAPRIVNLAEWRHHLLARLRAEIDGTGDPDLERLRDELAALPTPKTSAAEPVVSQIAVPLMLRIPEGPTLSMISTTTVFGTANDVTLAELTLESFFPADAETREYFARAADRRAD